MYDCRRIENDYNVVLNDTIPPFFFVLISVYQKILGWIVYVSKSSRIPKFSKLYELIRTCYRVRGIQFIPTLIFFFNQFDYFILVFIFFYILFIYINFLYSKNRLLSIPDIRKGVRWRHFDLL